MHVSMAILATLPIGLTGRNDALGSHIVKSFLSAVVQILLSSRDAGHLYDGRRGVDVWLGRAVIEGGRGLGDSALIGWACACVGED